MKLSGIVYSLADAAQLLAVDWLPRPTRPFWNAARKDIRTQRFRAHAALPVISLADLIGQLTQTPGPVTLPPAAADWAGVGDPGYYYALGAIAQAWAPTRVLEFGTYLGVGTLALALNTPAGARITTIDLPDEVDDHSLQQLESSDQALVQRSRQRIGQAFAAGPLAGKISQVRADSLAVDLGQYLAATDFALIDGGHSYDLIRSDTQKTLAILATPGLVLWDDYWWLYPDVVRYLDQLKQQLPLFRIQDTNLVVYWRR